MSGENSFDLHDVWQSESNLLYRYSGSPDLFAIVSLCLQTFVCLSLAAVFAYLGDCCTVGFHSSLHLVGCMGTCERPYGGLKVLYHSEVFLASYWIHLIWKIGHGPLCYSPP